MDASEVSLNGFKRRVFVFLKDDRIEFFELIPFLVYVGSGRSFTRFDCFVPAQHHLAPFSAMGEKVFDAHAVGDFLGLSLGWNTFQ